MGKGSYMNSMYIDTLMRLSAGILMPGDREVLSLMPLPESFVDPYASKLCEPQEGMRLAANMLNSWIEQSKKSSYFTKQFTDLSKMILNAVTTMGRGLMSMHMRGEDLEKAPMSIDDLLLTASYQLRKSYLGALQTMQKFPDVSARLMTNQVNWTNLLLRLYKTRDKLAEPVKPMIVTPELPEEKAKRLPAEKAVEALEAMTVPSALGGVRSLRALNSPAVTTGANREPELADPADNTPGEPSVINEKTPEFISETVSPEFSGTAEKTSADSAEEYSPESRETAGINSDAPEANDSPKEEPAGRESMPSYREKIMASASANNSEEPLEIAMTANEMLDMLEDVDFCQQHPDIAEAAYELLRQYAVDEYGPGFLDFSDELPDDEEISPPQIA